MRQPICEQAADGLQTKAIQLAGAVGPHQAHVFLNRNQHLLKLVMHDAMGTCCVHVVYTRVAFTVWVYNTTLNSV